MYTKQFGICRHRLDMYAAPIIIGKSFANGVFDRMLGSDINKKSVADVMKHAPEYDVLKILSE
jgi:hypothetical protein